MRVSWELEGRTPPWHCSPWTLSPRMAQRRVFECHFIYERARVWKWVLCSVYSRRADTGVVGCPIPEPPSLGVQPGLQGTDGLGEGNRDNVQFIRKTISHWISEQR